MSETSSVSVQLQDVSVAYADHEVLSGINLSIEPGEFFAFLGPSGSGKSTLLRLIAGFGPCPRGRVLINGEDVGQLPPWRRNVGLVFQNYALWPHLSVRKNVAFGLEERKLRGREIRARVDAALELVGLGTLAERRPAELSGGQQQRVALARTIVVEPRVLLLDEPLSNLDANLRIRMRGEIRELQQRLKITTVFVTHDQEEANTISDRMAVLDQGRLQQVGPPISLYDQPTNRFVARFLGSANLLAGVISTQDRRFRADCGIEIPLGSAPHPAAGRATALFRPQNIRFSVPDRPPTEPYVHIRGTIRQREFLGNLVRYSVRVGSEDVLVDDPHRQHGHLHGIGQSVLLSLASSQVRYLTES